MLLQFLLTVFFVVPLYLSAAYEVAICTIFQNDAPYLKEWIEFHRIQGVEHFYLYNNLSKDDFLPVLKPYIDENIVTLIDWAFPSRDMHTWNRIQCLAYMNCMETFGNECQWIAVIDTDEFLFCVDGTPLPHFLRNYESYAGVVVNWQIFGTSFVEEIPEKKLMIEVLTRCGDPYAYVNKYVKSIVQPKYVRKCGNPHFFLFKEKNAINSNGLKCMDQRSEIVIDKIRINHYWTRTEKYFRDHKIGKHKKWYLKGEKLLREEAAAYNLFESDGAILQFVEDLRPRVFNP